MTASNEQSQVSTKTFSNHSLHPVHIEPSKEWWRRHDCWLARQQWTWRKEIVGCGLGLRDVLAVMTCTNAEWIAWWRIEFGEDWKRYNLWG